MPVRASHNQVRLHGLSGADQFGSGSRLDTRRRFRGSGHLVRLRFSETRRGKYCTTATRTLRSSPVTSQRPSNKDDRPVIKRRAKQNWRTRRLIGRRLRVGECPPDMLTSCNRSSPTLIKIALRREAQPAFASLQTMRLEEVFRSPRAETEPTVTLLCSRNWARWTECPPTPN
jgi:hypothetical protein